MKTIKLVLLIVAAILIEKMNSAENDSAPSDIKLGMSTVITGPAADLGINMRDGVLAAIKEVNLAGGIKGRKLRLIVYDDGYEPQRAIPNMYKLAIEDKVDVVVGNVGTPTAVVTIPIAMEHKVPFYGAFTGAGVLRKSPPDHYVWNYRASYKEETAAMVDALLEYAKLKPEQIAFFTQRDAYGDAGFGGGMEALTRNGLMQDGKILHVRYERNTLSVEDALANILTSENLPKAVIMVGAYAPCAKFVKLASENAFKPIFLSVSFVGSDSLCSELGESGEGVIITQVVPHFESDLPACKDYRIALQALESNIKPSFGSLEGYLASRVLIKALNSCDGTPGRENLVRAFEAMGKFDAGIGVPLEMTAKAHQACHAVWPTVIRKGKVVPFDWKLLHQTGESKRHE